MIKAILFDIDGTLVTSQAKTVPSTRRALEAVQKQGIIVGVATGRGPHRLNEQINQLPLDVFITYNGQYVYDRERVLFADPFSQSVLNQIVDFAEQEQRQIMFGAADHIDGSKIMTLGQNAYLKRFAKLIPKSSVRSIKRLLQRFNPENRPGRYRELAILAEPIYQCVLLSPSSEAGKLENKLPEVHFTRSNPYTADMIPKGGSKLRGIERFAEAKGLELHEIMAFGDSYNDLEMLTGVGIGVAMGNARPKIKEIADYVTLPNDEDGIKQALIHYGLLEEGFDEDAI